MLQQDQVIWDAWISSLISRDISYKTKEKYKSVINTFLRSVKKSILHVTEEDIITYQNGSGEPKSSNYISPIRAYWTFAQSSASKRILALPLSENDLNASTIGEYLSRLFQTVWKETEGFSGYGHAAAHLETALISAGYVAGKIDKEGYVEESDSDALDKLILQCIYDAFRA